MEYTELFGEGTVYTPATGILSIPRVNLEAVGLQQNSTELVSIVTAILLLIDNYFVGTIVDSDGFIIIDDEGSSLGYDQNRAEMLLNSAFVGREFNLNGTKLFWDYHLSFFTLKP